MFLISFIGLLSQEVCAQEWPDLSIAPSPAIPHTVLDPSQEKALVVSIEKYSVLANVTQAKRTGRDWFRYLSRHRGIPVDQVIWLDGQAATAENIKAALDSITQEPAERYWVVFIGHGATVDKAPRILPVDTQDSYYDVLRKGLSIPNMLETLEESATGDVVALFDASFNEQWGNQALFSEPLPRTRAELRVSRASTVLFATQPSASTYLLSKEGRTSFGYLALGALRGWADANQDGAVRVRELIDYTQKALQTVQLPNLTQEPFWIGGNDIILGQTLEQQGPDLNALRKSLDPIVESKMGWDVEIRTGSGQSLDYDNLVDTVQAQAEAREEQRRKEDLRQGVLETKSKELQLRASNIWNKMSKARRLGGKEVYALVERYIQDFEDLYIEVDGASVKVDIPQVEVAKRWLSDKGRKIEGVLGYDMQLVTAAPFIMGSPKAERNRQKDEQLHEVSLKRDYYLGTFEVTQELWTTIMGSNPSHFQRCGARCPVESISWCDAVIFANRLSKREGFVEVYTLPYEFSIGMSEDVCAEQSRLVYADNNKNGYRLPTEAEWEYAARAGRDSLYSGSGDSASVAWTRDNSAIKVHSVCTLKTNDWGFCDMSGNVWELVWDFYAPYPINYGIPNYEGPDDGIFRILRGGSWGMDEGAARIANRHYARPGYRIRDVGLRLARTAR